MPRFPGKVSSQQEIVLSTPPLDGTSVFGAAGPSMNQRVLASAVALIVACFSAVGQEPTLIDQVPMYGGMDRSQYPELKAADEKLTEDASKHFGSREKAAAAWIEQGFRFYQQDRLDMAMRRFNQAWLLDPNNAEVYAGFAAVLHDQGKNCPAMKMMEEALSRETAHLPGHLSRCRTNHRALCRWRFNAIGRCQSGLVGALGGAVPEGR